jgi:hypothetical protein
MTTPATTTPRQPHAEHRFILTPRRGFGVASCFSVLLPRGAAKKRGSKLPLENRTVAGHAAGTVTTPDRHRVTATIGLPPLCAAAHHPAN